MEVEHAVVPSQDISEARLGKCEVCAFHDAKYTCPKCEVKTCSLKCNKIHKLEVECDGERDRTKFVTLKKFTNLDLSSDYKLLEEITRGMETVKKKFGRKFDSKSIPNHLFKLRNAAEQRKTTLKFLPFKFERHRKNTTQLNFKDNLIYWHIEWVFVNAEGLRQSQSRVVETERVGFALNKVISSEENVQSGQLKFYQAAGMGGLKLLLKAEQKKGKKYYELDPSESIKMCLSKKLIIEYPTICVLLKDHSSGYNIIDSDEEDEMEENEIKDGRYVVEKLIKKAESDESLYKSLTNLLFINEYSDED